MRPRSAIALAVLVCAQPSAGVTVLTDDEPFSLRSTAGTPRGSSAITLWDYPDFGQTIDLGVTSLPRESLPQHQGRISFLNSSFFGIELRMSFDATGEAAGAAAGSSAGIVGERDEEYRSG